MNKDEVIEIWKKYNLNLDTPYVLNREKGIAANKLFCETEDKYHEIIVFYGLETDTLYVIRYNYVIEDDIHNRDEPDILYDGPYIDIKDFLK